MAAYMEQEVKAAFDDAIKSMAKTVMILGGAALWAENTPHSVLSNSYLAVAHQLDHSAECLYTGKPYIPYDPYAYQPSDMDYARFREEVMTLKPIDAQGVTDALRQTENATKTCFYDVMNALAKAATDLAFSRYAQKLNRDSVAVWASASMMLLVDDISRGYMNEELLFIPDEEKECLKMGASIYDYDNRLYERQTYLPPEFRFAHYMRADGHFEGERLEDKHRGPGRLVICSGDEANSYIYSAVDRWMNNPNKNPFTPYGI